MIVIKKILQKAFGTLALIGSTFGTKSMASEPIKTNELKTIKSHTLKINSEIDLSNLDDEKLEKLMSYLLGKENGKNLKENDKNGKNITFVELLNSYEVTDKDYGKVCENIAKHAVTKFENEDCKYTKLRNKDSKLVINTVKKYANDELQWKIDTLDKDLINNKVAQSRIKNVITKLNNFYLPIEIEKRINE